MVGPPIISIRNGLKDMLCENSVHTPIGRSTHTKHTLQIIDNTVSCTRIYLSAECLRAHLLSMQAENVSSKVGHIVAGVFSTYIVPLKLCVIEYMRIECCAVWKSMPFFVVGCQKNLMVERHTSTPGAAPIKGRLE